jgi:hypothetical protein
MQVSPASQNNYAATAPAVTTGGNCGKKFDAAKDLHGHKPARLARKLNADEGGDRHPKSASFGMIPSTLSAFPHLT